MTNFHTHSLFCDGHDSPRELCEAALAKGFTALGFSGHSYTFFDERYCMSREATREYRKCISALKREYDGRLKIYCGVEQDYYSEESTEGYDFVIGSVHYVLKNGEYLMVDESADDLLSAIERHYGGDPCAFFEDYFAVVSDVVRKTGADIIGHFDLVTKFNSQSPFFDENDPRYLRASENAAASLLKTGAAFEINTGAMAKGYRPVPYPSSRLLRLISAGGGRVIINSDCHYRDRLDFAFKEAFALARECGFEGKIIETPWERP